MTVIKINALTVPDDLGDEVVSRFQARGAVDGAVGFEGFELLRPTDGRRTWLVVTRWADEDSFEAWRTGAGFAEGHRPPSADGEAAPPPRLPIESELWAYEVSVGS